MRERGGGERACIKGERKIVHMISHIKQYLNFKVILCEIFEVLFLQGLMTGLHQISIISMQYE